METFNPNQKNLDFLKSEQTKTNINANMGGQSLVHSQKQHHKNWKELVN
jgi:hypothetical protein